MTIRHNSKKQKNLPHLQVLNVGRNQIAGKVAVRLPALKALILNENRITLVGGAPFTPAVDISPESALLPARH